MYTSYELPREDDLNGRIRLVLEEDIFYPADIKFYFAA